MKNLETIWSKAAALGQTLKEYPRPDMVRRHWINLNGMWDYLITDSRILPWQFYESEYFPFDGQILVPFSPEAPLSQVKRQLLPDETLWYSRTIQLPENCLDTESQRLLLHFGAVDQICSVYINGKFVTYHKGGYLPFTTDITDFITEDLTVSILISVHDFSDTSYHARGKQQLKRGGMFYTAQSGIWQTVWMEIVPNKYIRDVRVTPDWDNSLVRMRIRVSSASSAENASPAHISPTAADQTDSQGTVLAFSPDRQNSSNVICKVYPPVFLEADGLNDTLCQDEITTAAIRPGKGATLSIPENMQKSWTPKEPWLYPYSLEYGKDRILETDRWYFHCDRMGMLVWQDMPNGGSSYHHWFVTYLATLLNWIRIPVKDLHARLLSRTDEFGRQEYIDDIRDMVRTLYNHPSIVTWVPFNEGWGQFSTKKVTDFIHRLDPSRLVDSASGWFDQGCGDINSLHYYFLGLPVPESDRVLALSEFGGYSLRLPEHSACKNIYGYKKFTTSEALTDSFSRLMENTIVPSVKKGYSATVFTQLSDIEEETNGLITYDRKKIKMNPLIVQKWNTKLKKSLHS